MENDEQKMLQCFEHYRQSFGARPPDLARQQYSDELKQFSHADGLRELPPAPATEFESGEPPEKFEDGRKKYLWVIAVNKVPYILEKGHAGSSLSRGRAAHTNLTGGDAVHCAGELWFRDETSFWLSGGSSRFRPRSAEELEDVVRAFRQAGFKVASFGWDPEAGPARFLRGEAVWT